MKQPSEAKKILVVPDVHGRTFWEEPVNKYLGLLLSDLDNLFWIIIWKSE